MEVMEWVAVAADDLILKEDLAETVDSVVAAAETRLLELLVKEATAAAVAAVVTVT